MAVLDRFRAGLEKVLITTNVLSRGIDVEQVTIVVNFDLPVDLEGKADCETYLYRIGRTGRFGTLQKKKLRHSFYKIYFFCFSIRQARMVSLLTWSIQTSAWRYASPLNVILAKKSRSSIPRIPTKLRRSKHNYVIY